MLPFTGYVVGRRFSSVTGYIQYQHFFGVVHIEVRDAPLDHFCSFYGHLVDFFCKFYAINIGLYEFCSIFEHGFDFPVPHPLLNNVKKLKDWYGGAPLGDAIHPPHSQVV